MSNYMPNIVAHSSTLDSGATEKNKACAEINRRNGAFNDCNLRARDQSTSLEFGGILITLCVGELLLWLPCVGLFIMVSTQCIGLLLIAEPSCAYMINRTMTSYYVGIFNVHITRSCIDRGLLSAKQCQPLWGSKCLPM